MFDIGASEIFVIGVVALIVIGPERLPRVAKTLGHLFGRLQRYVSEVKSDINREIELDELRKLKATMQDAARSIEQSVTSQVNYIDSEVRQAGAEVQKQVESVHKQVESAVAPATGIQLMQPTNTPAHESSDVPEAKPAAAIEDAIGKADAKPDAVGKTSELSGAREQTPHDKPG
jgi:sec-independent protein translocase protein TatB